MSKHPNASIMFPICTSCLSISHLKLFGCWQFIGFSSPGQGWAIIRPHHAWRGNHSGAFFSHGVFSQWQAHWLCIGSGCICLPACLRSGTSLRYTDRDRGGDRRGESDASGSFICNSNQAVYHTSPLHYHPAPRWEIYLRTVILSAKQSGTRTHRWLILSRHTLIYHGPVRHVRYSTAAVYWATDLVNPADSWKRCTVYLIIWPVHLWDAETSSVTHCFSSRFLIQSHLTFPDSCYHMDAIPFMLITCSVSRKKLRLDNPFCVCARYKPITVWAMRP